MSALDVGVLRWWRRRGDGYPPFRLYMGDGEPERPPSGDHGSVGSQAATPEPAPPPAGPPQQGRPWTGGRVIALVLGSLLALFSLGLIAGGIAVVVIDQTQRDSAGYISTRITDFESNGYAIVGSGLDIDTNVPDWVQIRELVGKVQIRVESTGDQSVFIGLARQAAAADYLAGLGYDEVSQIDGVNVTYLPHVGDAPSTPPADQPFWTASTVGEGPQTLTFEPDTGRWVIVAMNEDGSQGVTVAARAAAELPVMTWGAITLFVLGGLGLIVSGLPIYLAARR